MASIFLHHFEEVAFLHLYKIKYCKSKAMAILNIHQHHNQTSSEQNTWATMILKGTVLLNCQTNANSHRFVQKHLDFQHFYVKVLQVQTVIFLNICQLMTFKLPIRLLGLSASQESAHHVRPHRAGNLRKHGGVCRDRSPAFSTCSKIGLLGLFKKTLVTHHKVIAWICGKKNILSN